MGKFEIPIKMPTTQHSIRFPNELIDEVEEAIRGEGNDIYCICSCSNKIWNRKTKGKWNKKTLIFRAICDKNIIIVI